MYRTTHRSSLSCTNFLSTMSLNASTMPVQAEPTIIVAPTMLANMTAAELLTVCLASFLAHQFQRADWVLFIIGSYGMSTRKWGASCSDTVSPTGDCGPQACCSTSSPSQYWKYHRGGQAFGFYFATCKICPAVHNPVLHGRRFWTPEANL